MNAKVLEKAVRESAAQAVKLGSAWRNPRVDPSWLTPMPLLDPNRDRHWIARQSARCASLDAGRKAAFLEAAKVAPESLYESFRARYRPYREFESPVQDAVSIRQKTFPVLDAPLPVILDPPGRGEMWWGETRFWLPNRVGMDAIFTDQGLVLTGSLNWDDGDLYQSSLRIVSSFFCSPDRMPASTRVHSQPRGALHGAMFGHTSGFLFLFGVTNGDHWSKSTLRTAQRAFSIHPNNPGDVFELGPAARSESKIVDIEATNTHMFAAFPGQFPYAPMDLTIDHGRILRIDLEIDLLLQLEGEASIRFGDENSRNVLHNWSQWRLIDV